MNFIQYQSKTKIKTIKNDCHLTTNICIFYFQQFALSQLCNQYSNIFFQYPGTSRIFIIFKFSFYQNQKHFELKMSIDYNETNKSTNRDKLVKN